MASGHHGNVEHHVPHYDIYGHQHSREPYKDKSHLFGQDIRHERWLGPPPAVKTRAELQQARQKSRVPDSSYDFDGDGVVGQLDHFIGRCFDKDNDGRLTRSERGRAKKALDEGFLNKYVRGLDSTGAANRGCAVMQRRGVITMADNTQDISAQTYPPHHNAHMHPPHNTKTAMDVSRTAEAKAAGGGFGERYAKFCAPVLEREPPNHRTQPRTCPIEHIRERAEADHQASRVRAGLLSQNAAVNPEREQKAVGLDHVAQPLFATRGQLLETRKELMKREAEDLALKAEETCVPLSVRRTEKDIREFDFRRPGPEAMTLTRLKDQRKRDRIEHDMQHFARPNVNPRVYPKFSDNPEVPFWLSDRPEQLSATSSPVPAMSRTVSEPAMKVTDVPFGHEPARQVAADLPGAAHAMAAAAAGKAAHGPEAKVGARTVKRWTAEMAERGEGRNKPRLFDSIQPVRIGPSDLQSIDVSSSMEPVRRAAQERLRGNMSTNSTNPMMSRLWSDPSFAQTDGVAGGGAGSPPERKATKVRVPKVQSEPMLRGSMEKAEIPHEPRFFGSVTHISRPAEHTAVRCGGFHRAALGTQDRTAQSHQKNSKSTKGGDAMAMP